MGQRNNKKISILIILILIIIIIYKIVNTYALFYSVVSGNVVFQNGVWVITVNGDDITSGTEVKFDVDDFNISTDQHVLAGKIAPGLSGSFSLEIDPTDTDVSVRYDITIDEDEIEVNTFRITSIEINDENMEIIQTAQNTYTGVFLLEDIQNDVTATINVFFEWEDNNIESENNEDTNIASEYNAKFEIPVTVRVIQYLNEEIIEYVEEETGE